MLKAPSAWRGAPAPVFWHTGDESWQKLDGGRYAQSVAAGVQIDLGIHARDSEWQKFLAVYPSLAENIPAPLPPGCQRDTIFILAARRACWGLQTPPACPRATR